MDGQFDIFSLLFLVLAVVIFLKLRSVLGRKTGDERTQYDRYNNRDNKGAGRDKVVTLPRRGVQEGSSSASPQSALDAQEQEIRGLAKSERLADGFIAIWREDRRFSPDEFLKGAKTAYEMIVSAFAEGNKKALRGLLSGDVYEGFSTAISDRSGRGEKIDQNFVGISKADIIEAELQNDTAQVTVKFVSELISATLDRAGSVISGDPNGISEVTDVWTFARNVTSNDPNWKLIATQAAH